MILSSIFIDNFRNLKNVFIELTDFEMLIGENNIGKTNILIALSKVLNGKYFSVHGNDFGDKSKQLKIEITFTELGEKGEAIFHDSKGLLNPKSNEVKIRFCANFNKYGTLNRETYFIREDRGDLATDNYKIKNFIPSKFKVFIPFYFVSASRNINDLESTA